MDHYDKELVKRIERLSNDMLNDEIERVPLHIYGKLIKKILIRDNVFLTINNKRMSPNKYISMYYKNFSSFIKIKTKHNIEKEDDIFYIVFS